MSSDQPSELTVLLHAATQGDPAARHRLLPLIYGELKGIAERHVRKEAAGNDLGATEVVHELYVRLFGSDHGLGYADRRHFFAVCARQIRHILVDHARHRAAAKRGGAAGERLSLDAVLDRLVAKDVDYLELHEALETLDAANPRWSDVLTLRAFGGLTVREVAEELGVSERTVHADYRFALAFLHDRLGAGENS